ncbi:head-tail connector protein [Mesorhizobium sp. M00.F.Ca.ET.217.01.1.1]|uniref:head-tail connector protein n=1 Tax=Mesorhizobium sp. M00.F.Ca.ET.217.01.1.1 TaxID=2500529 RepID=UPI000FDB65DE|nr:head-tail connector protein [Mesorhizobium sp. M00.F.Ca.ET.217.01.1.1]TGQ19319.1 phage gp6-like head-tail connector protein [Mesorhizobium sp. M00.F.Ca.ET.217.01.1.1]TIU12455.1 MAG: phage gp6-like head-tail connector protein [Mesorhizobium sp.]
MLGLVTGHALRLVTAPSEAAVSLVEAKRHTRIDHSDDDEYIQSLVDTAIALIDGADGWLGRALVTQTWDHLLDAFPRRCAGDMRRYLPIIIPLAPTITVDTVAYTAQDGTDTSISDFRTFNATSSQPAYIIPAIDGCWPVAKCEPEAVRIRFTAGFGNAAKVPAAIKHAILLMVGHWYENREDVVSGSMTKMPLASESLLMPFRNWRG